MAVGVALLRGVGVLLGLVDEPLGLALGIGHQLLASLRASALQPARSSGRSERGDAAQVALLVAQIGRLSLSVSALRQAQGRAA